MKDLSFEPVSCKKVSVDIFEQINEMIVNGTLKPGDKLPSERAMMNMFNRSRPPIREALRMLENAGIIEIIPGSGAVVTMPDTTLLDKPFENLVTMRSIPVSDLTEYRKLTEIAVVCWAAERRTEEDLKAMMQCIITADAILDSDADEFFEQDIKFHHAIAASSKNQIAPIFCRIVHNMISDVLRAAFSKKTEAERLNMCREIVCVHRLIYSAIYDQNVEQAKKIMEIHLDSFSMAGNRFQDK